MQMEESNVLKLEKATRQRGVCLLVARSYGLVGYLRVSSRPQHATSMQLTCQPLGCLNLFARSKYTEMLLPPADRSAWTSMQSLSRNQITLSRTCVSTSRGRSCASLRVPTTLPA